MMSEYYALYKSIYIYIHTEYGLYATILHDEGTIILSNESVSK